MVRSTKNSTFAPVLKRGSLWCTLSLGYGVMVTLQILVLPFLVRVRVPQQIYLAFSCPGRVEVLKGIGVWCNGNTADSGPAFSGSSPDTPTYKMAVE